MKSQIAVIEGKWWPHSNVSVRALFDLIVKLQHETEEAYHYEMFCDGAALDNIARRVAQSPELKCAYVASHGSESGIHGSDGATISRTKIRNIFTGFYGRPFDGLYFGTCGFLSQDNAEFLMSDQGAHGKGTFVWVAGYDRSIGWVDSSALDMIFWSTYMGFAGESGGAKQQVKSTAAHLRNVAGDLAANLGFHVYVRGTGRSAGRLVDLMAE